MSCYVPALCEHNGRLRKAACGRWVVPATEHSNEPTCPTCQQWIKRLDEEDALTGEDMFGAPDPFARLVHDDRFDRALDGYRPRERNR